jgi:hypothetical protein
MEDYFACIVSGRTPLGNALRTFTDCARLSAGKMHRRRAVEKGDGRLGPLSKASILRVARGEGEAAEWDQRCLFCAYSVRCIPHSESRSPSCGGTHSTTDNINIRWC